MKRSPRRRFAYRLAVGLGYANVDALLRSLTAKQFMEWELYEAVEPFGEVRADWRAASIREMVFNMAVAKEDRKPVAEFLLKFIEEEKVVQQPPKNEPQSWQQQLAIAHIWAQAMARSEQG